MIYRELGNTGIMLSEIGLGCEGFNGKDDDFTRDMFTLAFERGVNCMDLYSPNPDMHRRIGRAVANKRSDFILQAHLCTMWKNEQYEATRDIREVNPAFESMLKNLGTDYIDIGMIHYVDSIDTWNSIANGEIMQYALEQKGLGRLKHIGISSHNPIVALAAAKSSLIEVLMFSVNPCYDLLPGGEDCESLWADESYEKPLFNLNPQREALYETCQRLGVGITVMKAFGGGDLLSDESPAGKALTAEQCIHYALTRPGVSTVFAGAHTREELIASLNYESATAEQRDYAAAFATFPKISWQGHCMYCGHCAPCPKGIDVASVTKFLNLSKAQGAPPETVAAHYASLSATAKDCVECGSCESRCPFGVAVIDNMKDAKIMFGK